MRKGFPGLLVSILLLVGVLAALAGPAAAVDPTAPASGGLIAPDQIRGAAVYVPFDAKINVDGKLDDWANIPIQKVDYGPQPSKDPLDDGSFTFQVAADETNFYIHMSAVDNQIVAGKHGFNFWNEDSMEFYFNTGPDLNITSYDNHAFQINVNAADIGNTNPDGLTLTGVNSSKIHVHGYVFKVTEPEQGWGFEASVPMKDLGIEPAHGKSIGFQAQLNGAATGGDRDVQLSWSIGDVKNTSYQDPSVFGAAIFYKIGSTSIPTPEHMPSTPTPKPTAMPPLVSVNEVGYYPKGPKFAAYDSPEDQPLDWQLVDSDGNAVAHGKTRVVKNDDLAGSNVHVIDFSSYQTAGLDYTVAVGGVSSDKFKISDDVNSALEKDALAYFYRDRSGIEILSKYAGFPWARAAGHLSDNHVTCYKGKDSKGVDYPGCDYYLDVSGGWYDAGDYGKYVVSGAIAVWTLMNEYEQNPKAIPDGSLSIPENSNGISDILDESRWEMQFLLEMQVPDGQPLAGMVHHKVHDDAWSAVPSMPLTNATNRYLFPPSTAATLDLAATGAQCARIWKTIDPAFSDKCLAAAQKAWAAAVANPAVYAPSFVAGGGDYGDTNVTDEFYWAASELFVTTGDSTYKSFLTKSPDWRQADVPDWANTATLGTISLALVPNKLSGEQIRACRDAITRAADQRLDAIGRNGYRMPLTGFAWGSNSEDLNSGMLMGLAYKFTSNRKYLNGAIESMDYVLGMNILNRSFVTGYGTITPQHPHHRFWADQPSNGYPAPPPGVVVGGANDQSSAAGDTAAANAGLYDLTSPVPGGKSYVDNLNSFTTNEVAINWNAPLAWLSAFVDQSQNGGIVATPAAARPNGGLPLWVLILLPVIIAAVLVEAAWLWRKKRIARAAK